MHDSEDCAGPEFSGDYDRYVTRTSAKKIADGLLTDLYVRSIIYHNQKKAMIKRSKRFLPTERVDRRMPAVSRPGLGTAERSL